MADNDFTPMQVAHTANKKAPLTPLARLSHSPELAAEGAPVNNLLEWQPIEYIGKYIVLRDGQPVAETRNTSFEAVVPGEYQVIGVSTDGVQSFASEPLNNFATTVIEMPGESTALKSAEVSYQPAEGINGYHGLGFVEVDHSTAPINIKLPVAEEGTYSISLVYANGNGPVNTENKCAIRTLTVDGNKAGTIVMPHRGVGNWSDWGRTNNVVVPLSAGNHEIGIAFFPEDENMNLNTNHAIIDRVIVQKIK